MKQAKIIKAGLDIGSTTAKMVLLDPDGKLIFWDYQRHHADIFHAVLLFLNQIVEQFPHICLDLKLTGSAALDVSQRLHLPFVQEVIATHGFVKTEYPGVRTALDIGGEDAKVIFINPQGVPDIRMNGSCAGGTGSFIDQMASLLNITPFELNTLAAEHTHIYPVASRCGVFAKTDVQNMLSRNIPHSDIAASIFHSVAIQCINSLARGKTIQSKIMLCGGVFCFLPELVNQFLKVLDFSRKDLVIPEKSELVPAMGAARFERMKTGLVSPAHLLEQIKKEQGKTGDTKNRMTPLFNSREQFNSWTRDFARVDVPEEPLEDYQGQICFIGIDSGSTTTKIIVIGENQQVLFSWYAGNHGTPVKTVIKGLEAFKQDLEKTGKTIQIARTAVTGYGEDLIRAAFDVDEGIVETLAHKTAACFIDPKVSFILDIGGQDMKAMFIDNGEVSQIEVNEACSSGCGSFLETFANALDYTIEDFAQSACDAQAPCDLGTRCTVFMNSKVKQALRENASVGDISAGLAYSVIKNCLFKVLKLHDMSGMGRHIVLQGGTFKNPAIVRAMEVLSGCSVSCSNLPELMGAFGAALSAEKVFRADPKISSLFYGLENLDQVNQFKTSAVSCKGCENTCRVTRFVFANKKTFYSGNKCEKYYTAKGKRDKKGFDFIAFKNRLLFDRQGEADKETKMVMGIPRVLEFYENYPFWHTLLTHCGFKVCLSSSSTVKLNESGMGTVMSDNICFPAKLVHGHIMDLVQKKVDRICYPIVMYETPEFDSALNTYNCPVVSSYADVIHSAMDPEGQFGIPLDRPVVSFQDPGLLEKTCCLYLKQFKIKKSTIRQGIEKALSARSAVKKELKEKAAQLIYTARENQSLLIVLAGRPYHADSLVNHKLPDMLTGMGADIITEESVPACDHAFDDVQVVTQWSYANRIYHAAAWVADQPDHIQMVQVNSFGCGPDAVVVDEAREILKTKGKNHTLLKVDEISSPGSVRLRLRSMVESLKSKAAKIRAVETHSDKTGSDKNYLGEIRSGQEPRIPFVRFLKKDRKRTIWAPFFSDDYSAYLPAVFKNAGYEFKILPKPDRQSVDLGLQYASHDLCYPGTLVIGDILKALKSQTYRPDDIAIGITQTGGQCRASNYLPLIRKAMVRAGFDEIPLISVTASQGLVDQPGFHINWLMKSRLLFTTTMVADCLARMYYATAPREKNKGMALKLRCACMDRALPVISAGNCSGMISLLDQAVDAFNTIPVHEQTLPRVGVVGEIYAKYNYFANQDLVHWLIEKKIEPVLPPIIDFFIQDLVNYKENIKAGIRRKKITDLIGVYLEMRLGHYHKKINQVFSRFRHAIALDDIHQVAQKASDILSMTSQFGEGWLIPGEIGMFAGQGINHVVSLQPFGCIANHIVSKGVEKRIKEKYPHMNLHFLDFDAGMSEANVLNRLYMMTEHV